VANNIRSNLLGLTSIDLPALNGQHFQDSMPLPLAYKHNPALCRSSLLDGSQLALSSLNGAAYHLKRLSEILDEAERVWWEAPDFEKGKLLTSHEINEVLWHLRSFFWELVGVFDLMLQWTNEHFHLGVPEDKVKWRTIKSAQSKVNAPAWPTALNILSDARDSAWYFDVRTYRNFAHRSFLHLASLIPRQTGKIIVALEAARENAPLCADIRDELPKYVAAMRELGGKVFSS
jgi:hypothetical protein